MENLVEFLNVELRFVCIIKWGWGWAPWAPLAMPLFCRPLSRSLRLTPWTLCCIHFSELCIYIFLLLGRRAHFPGFLLISQTVCFRL